ncbi:hypothetical protein D3H35_00235 [Cohnella faecalis]|uniref:Uncharacterized protein n=1 Tax=Cohnella faecalis TaxID=2315694 RepID=A0A398CSD7_9BACL|nr:hypothetical protein D3H35_00235 [Cohnella faecalis]
METRVRSLKPVKEASIVKHFPGKLTVKLQEFEEVATELGADGKVQAVLANGLVLPSKQGALPDKPILTGWKTGRELSGAVPDTEPASGSLADGFIRNQARSFQILSRPDQAVYRSRFEVVTTVGKLSEKIIFLSDIVENREPGRIVLLEATPIFRIRHADRTGRIRNLDPTRRLSIRRIRKIGLRAERCVQARGFHDIAQKNNFFGQLAYSRYNLEARSGIQLDPVGIRFGRIGLDFG